MLVFVEGRDGSGKTMLCNQLAERGFTVIRVARGANHQFIRFCKLDGIYIFDRSFITDIVYRILDGECTELSLAVMCRIIREGKVKIIHCCTDNDFENSMARGETNIIDKDKSEQLEIIYNNIIDMFIRTENVPVLKFNWQLNSITSVLDFITDK